MPFPCKKPRADDPTSSVSLVDLVFASRGSSLKRVPAVMWTDNVFRYAYSPKCVRVEAFRMTFEIMCKGNIFFSFFYFMKFVTVEAFLYEFYNFIVGLLFRIFFFTTGTLLA